MNLTTSKKTEKKPVGRPTKYTEEWLKEEAKALLNWIAEDNDKKIYIGTFAFERGYHRKRLAEFVKVSVEFSSAMEAAKAWQENKFLQKGLSREWDSAQVRYTMARVCDPEWKASWDKEDKEEVPSKIIQHVVRYTDIPKESDAKVD